MTNEFNNHKEFFECHGKDVIELWPNDISMSTAYVITVEELYQHFKARMLDETVGKLDKLLHPAELVSTVEKPRRFVPLTPSGTAWRWLEADTENRAWKNLRSYLSTTTGVNLISLGYKVVEIE